MAVLAPPDRRPAEPGTPGQASDPAATDGADAAPRDGNPVATADVTAMFDEIAPVYDRLNTVMTLGRDAARPMPPGCSREVRRSTSRPAPASWQPPWPIASGPSDGSWPWTCRPG
jgi:hypothetical protein